jgi:hypothetical protein
VIRTALIGLALAAGASLPPFTVLAKAGPATTSRTAVLEHVRVGRHPGFDRVVFEFRAGTPAWSARYVPQVVHDGSGLPVALPGTAFLHLVFKSTRIDRASAGAAPITRTPRFRSLLQLKESGDFEGVVSFGLGLRRKVGFRGFRMTAPGRVVVDVAR